MHPLNKVFCSVVISAFEMVESQEDSDDMDECDQFSRFQYSASDNVPGAVFLNAQTDQPAASADGICVFIGFCHFSPRYFQLCLTECLF